MLNEFAALSDTQDRERQLIWRLENQRFARESSQVRPVAPRLAALRHRVSDLLHHRATSHRAAAC